MHRKLQPDEQQLSTMKKLVTKILNLAKITNRKDKTSVLYGLGLIPLIDDECYLIGYKIPEQEYDEEEDIWFDVYTPAVLFNSIERQMLRRAGIKWSPEHLPGWMHRGEDGVWRPIDPAA